MILNEAAAIRAGDILTVPQLIRMHGDCVEKLSSARHKLALLTEMRMSITEEEGEGELILASVIREYESILLALATALGWEKS